MKLREKMDRTLTTMSWARTRRTVSIIDMVEVATEDMATVDMAMDLTEAVKARRIGVRCGHDDQEAKVSVLSHEMKKSC